MSALLFKKVIAALPPLNTAVFTIFLSATLLSSNINAAPLMDLVDVEGVRENQLIGYGLVVGLDGTGDKNQVKFTSQSVANMVKQFGVNLPSNVDPKLKNVAAVTVTATIPPHYGSGQSVDVTVSSLGDAKSLRGGQLLMTQLVGIDGEIYAIAQGALIIGGMNAEGKSGSSVSINSSNSGLIPNGAIIEREIPSDFSDVDTITLNIKKPNFQTANNIVNSINSRFGAQVAAANNPTRVVLTAPSIASQRLNFMAMLENINIEEGRTRPKVVFNSRTGTVVIGEGVRVKAAAVSHGALTVTINENPQVSQPNAFSNGRTTVVPDSSVAVQQDTRGMFKWHEGATLDSIIKTINSLGASPDDIMSILQALERAGALNADVVVI